MQNVAILGGTFNPIHWGHLLLAETALDQFGLDRVIWVPTCNPPHKDRDLLMFSHRLEMVRRAIADHSAFTVSDIDAHRCGVSYAITTLTDLQAFYPNTNWFWIIGIDAFQTLPKWRESEALMAQCTWLVAPRRMSNGERQAAGSGQRAEGDRRSQESELTQNLKLKTQNLSSVPGPQSSALSPQSLNSIQNFPSPLTSYPSPLPRWHRLNMPEIGISSSLIRQACRDGHSIRYLVPEAVRLYILEFKLYGK
ncbi:nicotinate (nicotinamide) nucleotide adenylyltransferase [Kovacikia minuta CCNUW1]|uniref:nicotinate (nicotinamide) nucleotide adenylyltransferase n=1 Tax=Kovacikia minuta TaxID=2931930 RepID=UPI001CC97624|nr:nicotinate (nicotinamide) nucleotide adenylyltransferase [Kovacikia minuta]UBF25530.1 nicotinate (nicotinamide) nucleotide adenylyltransferase [Kovacikia minuta CCNUW1]